MRSIRSRSSLSGLLIALGLAVAACGGSAATEPSAGAPEDADAADADGANSPTGSDETATPAAAAISNITSETFDLTTYTGEDTLFWFWAPW